MNIVESLETLTRLSFYFAVSVLILATIVAILVLACYEVGLRSYLNRVIFLKWLKVRKYKCLDILKRIPYEKKKDKLSIIKLISDDLKFDYININRIEQFILELTGSVVNKRIYSLSTQQLCGQIGGTTQSYLNASSFQFEYIILLMLLISSNSKPDFDILLETASSNINTLDDKLNPTLKEIIILPIKNHIPIEIKRNLSFQIERSIDDLQATLNILLSRYGYIFSFYATLLLMTLFSLEFINFKGGVGDLGGVGDFTLYCFVVIFTGLLSPIIRSILEKLLLLYKD